MAVQYLTEGYVSVQRIEYLLMQADIDEFTDDININPEIGIQLNSMKANKVDDIPVNVLDVQIDDPTALDAVIVKVTDMTASWIHKDVRSSEETNVLKSINLSIFKDELIVVIGTVGSSKSSLLMSLLKELYPSKGSVEIDPSVSIGYCAQDHWIISNTIRHNILFGRDMDDAWYDKVIKCCALDSDLQLLPHGDLTIIGDRGVNLSGGQRARIGLARAVYGKAALNLLDDPLSAVDPKVSSHLFHDVICGLLRNSARVLVTHQTQYLANPSISRILILDNGKVVALDTYKALQSSGQLDQWVNAVVVDDMRRRTSSARSVDVSVIIPPSLQDSTAVDGKVWRRKQLKIRRVVPEIL